MTQKSEVDERELFEAWAKARGGGEFRADSGEYRSAVTEAVWNGWEARAAVPAVMPHDFITHKEAWREALRHCAERADTGEDAAYWQHELNAYDTAHAELAAAPQAPAVQPQEPVAWLREEYNGTGRTSVQINAPPVELPLREQALCVRYTPLYAAPQAEARQEPKPNTCKLTECQGKPRCEPCLVMDSSYPAQPSGDAATARDAGAMWDRFIAHLNECDSIEHVNLLGGVAKYRQAFIDAALSSTPAQGDTSDVALPAPSAEQLLDGAEFVQHRGGGQFRTCAEWDASGVFVPLGKWHALVKRLAGVPASDPDRFIGGAAGEAIYGVPASQWPNAVEVADALRQIENAVRFVRHGIGPTKDEALAFQMALVTLRCAYGVAPPRRCPHPVPPGRYCNQCGEVHRTSGVKGPDHG